MSSLIVAPTAFTAIIRMYYASSGRRLWLFGEELAISNKRVWIVEAYTIQRIKIYCCYTCLELIADRSRISNSSDVRSPIQEIDIPALHIFVPSEYVLDFEIRFSIIG